PGWTAEVRLALGDLEQKRRGPFRRRARVPRGVGQWARFAQDEPLTLSSHLRQLEAESIHIFREVMADCERPVLLYSTGKDSSVLLHLAMKAFHPGKPPFPLLHVDTTWKFRDMIAFRDETARRLGLELIVHINRDGLEQGISPLTHGSGVHTDVMKTQGLRQ